MLSVINAGIQEGIILDIDDYRSKLRVDDTKRKIMSTVHRTVKKLAKSMTSK